MTTIARQSAAPMRARVTALLDLHLSPDAWTTLTAGHGLGWDEAEALTVRARVDAADGDVRRPLRAPLA